MPDKDAARGSEIIDKTFVLPESALAKFIIVIGASTGGTEALVTLLGRLPPRMPGIAVVQHMPPVFTKMFADRLNEVLPFKAAEATHGAMVEPGTIHIAPGDRQMTVAKVGGAWQIRLGDSEKVGGHCPAVDVLFDSAAKHAGASAVGIILTGMGGDGAKGLLNMRRRGAYTIGQDESTCVVYGMPKKAFECGGVCRQAALTDIPRVLLSYLAKNA